jgi:tetratricopeptide (TPR) repeat protein
MKDKLQEIEMNVEIADKFHGEITSDSWLMDAINRNDVLWLINQVKQYEADKETISQIVGEETLWQSGQYESEMSRLERRVKTLQEEKDCCFIDWGNTIEMQGELEKKLQQANEKIEQLQMSLEQSKSANKRIKKDTKYIDYNRLLDRFNRQKEKLERYEKALEFYADEDNYFKRVIPPVIESNVVTDKGEVARKALEEPTND